MSEYSNNSFSTTGRTDTKNPVDDIASTLTQLPLMIDTLFFQMCMNPGLLNIYETSIRVIRVIALVIFIVWSILLYKAYQAREAGAMGSIVQAWYTNLVGLAAILGFIVYFVMLIVWYLLDVSTYKHDIENSKILEWLSVYQENKVSVGLFDIILKKLPVPDIVNPSAFLANLNRGMKIQLDAMNIFSGIMQVTLVLSIASLVVFMTSQSGWIMITLVFLMVVAALGGGIIFVSGRRS